MKNAVIKLVCSCGNEMHFTVNAGTNKFRCNKCGAWHIHYEPEEKVGGCNLSEVQAEKMTPGRELDALIAEKVFLNPVEAELLRQCIKHSEECNVPHFSTSIADAWQVVEKLGITVGPMIEGVWRAAILGPEGEDFNDIGEWNEAKSAPHAICLAALKAVGC